MVGLSEENRKKKEGERESFQSFVDEKKNVFRLKERRPPFSSSSYLIEFFFFFFFA